MIDVQRGIVRTNNGAGNVAAFYIGPSPGVAVNTLVPPANHDMGTIKLRVCELVGANEIAQVIASSRYRDDQADMHAIGFHKNVDPFRR